MSPPEEEVEEEEEEEEEPMAECSEHYNGPSGFINFWKFLDQLDRSWLPKGERMP